MAEGRPLSDVASPKPEHQAGLQTQIREMAALDLEGLRPNCLVCGIRLSAAALYLRFRVCPGCGFHYHMPARARIEALADEGSFEETSAGILPLDPLEFSASVPYKSRVLQDQTRTGLQEAAVTGTCAIGGTQAVIIVLDFGFLGGSMGLVVGEKVALALELAARKRLPAVAIITSGGARIQEGVLSLMQMAKTALAANDLHEEGLPLISVLGNPATGQVLASFGSLADIILAEPGAHIGFAPHRALHGASHEHAHDEQYAAESFFGHGQVDRIVERDKLKHELASLLEILAPEFRQQAAGKARGSRPRLNPREPWEMVQLARRPDRPRAMDYIQRMFSPFIELHGDRLYGDDPAVVTGLARLGAESVVVIAQQKSRPAQADIEPSTGAPASLPAESRGEITPEGFRKASRAVQLAARFKLPVISLIDTPGPKLGLEMEQRGLANAIAGSITSMLRARTPSISVLIGEGGSEAALAFGVADRVLMLQNAIYTPISPEDGAASEHRDPGRASDMARALKLTSLDCLRMGAIDAVVPEPPEGAHGSPEEAARLLRRTLMRELAELRETRVSSLVKRRRKKYRKIGQHVRNPQVAKEAPAPRRRTWRSGLFRRGSKTRDERPKDERVKKVKTAGKAAKPEKGAKTPKSAPPAEAVAKPVAGPAATKPAESASKVAKRRSRLRAVLLRRRGKPATRKTEPDARDPKDRAGSPGDG